MCVAEFPLVTRLLTLSALMVAASAWGVMPLDRARSENASATAALANVRSSRAALEGSLDRVAREIEQKKASNGGSNSGLSELLKKSHELGAALEAASRDETRLASQAEATRSALVESLDVELKSAEGRLDSAQTHEDTRHLSDQIKTLRTERDRLRVSGQDVKLPVVTPGRVDPVELREQADALRDTADKLRRELAQLDVRIRDLKEERELDRRMRESMGESALFDENDRRFSDVTPSGSALLGAAGPAQAAFDNTTKSNVPSPAQPSGGAVTPSSAQPPSSAIPIGVPQPGSTMPGLTDTGANGAGAQGAAFGAGPRITATQDPTHDTGPRTTDGLSPQDPPPGYGSPYPPQAAHAASSTAVDSNASLEDLVRRRHEVERQSQDLLKKAADFERQARQLE